MRQVNVVISQAILSSEVQEFVSRVQSMVSTLQYNMIPDNYPKYTVAQWQGLWVSFSQEIMDPVMDQLQVLYDACSGVGLQGNSSLCHSAVLNDNVWLWAHSFAMTQLMVMQNILQINYQLGESYRENSRTWITILKNAALVHYNGLKPMWNLLNQAIGTPTISMSCESPMCNANGCQTPCCMYTCHAMFSELVGTSYFPTITSLELVSEWNNGCANFWDESEIECADQNGVTTGCVSGINCDPWPNQNQWFNQWANEKGWTTWSSSKLGMVASLLYDSLKGYGLLGLVDSSVIEEEVSAPTQFLPGWPSPKTVSFG